MFLGALWISACGVKTPIVHPGTDLPGAVSGLEIFVRGEEMLLTWAAPDEKQRAGIGSYKVFAEASDEVRKVRHRCRKFRELAVLDLAQPDEKWIKNGRVELGLPVNPELLGKTYRYVVVPVSSTGYAGYESEEIMIRWTQAPPPPQGLKAKPGDRSVLLKWKSGAGKQVTPVNIYRRTAEQAFPLHPLNPVPVSENEYRDQQVQNGVSYVYGIRSVGSDLPPWIESPTGPEVKVTPADLLAPAPPSGVEVIAGKNLVRLFWRENKEDDVAGYRIYRRSKGVGGFEKIGEVRQPMTVFTDNDAQDGILYEYSVSAFDNAPVSNESGPSKIVGVGP